MRTHGDAEAVPHDPSRMHPDIAGNWALWSGIVNQSAITRLEQLKSRFPELTSAVLGTADGLHIASIGLDPQSGEHLAAMNGSLFGVARAEAEIISGGTEPTLSAIVSLSVEDSQMALLSFILAPYGQLLLSVSAAESQLGAVIVHARSTAYELLTALGVTGTGV
ncbi:roadblock/LC7 domain-containing protein [Aneurinibacillus sp. BA2021]|uniref:roadblock/LC7 domain-containing protein n=1 Tax=Microbacterium sp. PF5 TaxID=2305435 RepID=UPI00109BBDB8|nr:roadblock/LC7 domain-containing protein [Microbacterium sp. PF5]MBN6191124.1 roadblock/LC7 domain-containing protein [Aneurinibacillus sp. BA2021]